MWRLSFSVQTTLIVTTVPLSSNLWKQCRDSQPRTGLSSGNPVEERKGLYSQEGRGHHNGTHETTNLGSKELRFWTNSQVAFMGKTCVLYLCVKDVQLCIFVGLLEVGPMPIPNTSAGFQKPFPILLPPYIALTQREELSSTST